MTDGRTHWHGCHKEHHDCALALLARWAPLMMEAGAWLDALLEADTPTRVGAAAIRRLRSEIDHSLNAAGYTRDADSAGEVQK